VLRAVVAVVLGALLAWAAYGRLTGDDPAAPAAAPAPAPAAADATPGPTVIGPPPWVRYPRPRAGEWTADSGRLTLVVANERLTLTDVTHYRSLRYIRVEGHRVHLRPTGAVTKEPDLATYRWQIAGDRLTFSPLTRPHDSALPLESLTFHRRG
jgi:hypothetical protein